MDDVVAFHVARPFSANRMYGRQVTKRGHRNLTREYKAWRDEMGWALKMELAGMQFAGPQQITCRYDMTIELCPTRMDADNPVKPIGDLMQSVGLVSNDRNLNDFNVVRVDDRDDVLVVLTLRPDLAVRSKVAPKPHPKAQGKPKTTAGKLAAWRRAGVTV